MSKKRIGAWLATFVMAIALALGIASPALGAPVTSTSTGSVTLENIEKGAKIDVYHVITVNWDDATHQPQEPVYKWNDDGEKSVADWVKVNHPDYINADTNAVTDKFKTDDDAKVFYDALSAAIANGDVSLSPEQPTITAGENETVVSGLPLGTHLFIIGSSTNYVYQPVAQNVVPVWNDKANEWQVQKPNINVEVKRSELDIDKTVENVKITGAQYGDVLDFKLVSAVPTYPENAVNKLYGISDTMNPEGGLTFVEGSVKVYGLQSKDQDPTEGELLIEGTHYTKDGKDSATPANDVTFGLHFKYDEISKYKYIAVTYQGILNSNADLIKGAENEAHLEWNNNPYDENGYDEIPDQAKVYPYGLDVLKVDSGKDKTPLAGAEFTLNIKGDDNLLKFVKDDEGKYHVYDDEVDKGRETTTALVVNGEGKLVVDGLDKDVTYVLTETKAPEGYVKPSGSIEFTITDADDDGLVDNENNTAYIHKTISNDKGFDLPATGGAGTIAITAVGVCVMVGAAVVLVRTRKNN